MNWPLANFLLLGVVLLGGAVFVTWFFVRARNWTVPRQDSLIRELRQDVDAAHGIAEGVAREHGHEVRRNQDQWDAMLREIKKVGAQVEELLKLRDQLREVDDRTVQLDQAVSALACSEKAWMAAGPAGYCPLHKVDCPLQTKEAKEAE